MTINLATLYVWSRTVHRICVVAMLIFTMLMGGTGAVLKYPAIVSVLPIDPGLMRAVHNGLSTWFLAILGVMACTGTYLYVYPWYVRHKTRKTIGSMKPVSPPIAAPASPNGTESNGSVGQGTHL